METLKALLNRVSMPKLSDPAPSKDQMAKVYQAALRAPDHAWLRPWRFIEASGSGREKLGEALVRSAKRMNIDDEEKLSRYKVLPQKAPVVITLIAEIVDKPNVPEIEQIQSTAAAAQNILLALHDMGFGAYWRTGIFTSATNNYIAEELNLSKSSIVLGYLYVGTPDGEGKQIPILDNENFVTYWNN